MSLYDLCKIFLSYRLAGYNKHKPEKQNLLGKDLVTLIWEECRSFLIYILAWIRYALNTFR